MSDSVPVTQLVPVAPVVREPFWWDAVTAFATSDLSVREFC